MAAVSIVVVDTAEFRRWFAGVRDRRAKGRILARLRRLSLGNFGDARSLGGGLHELRIDYGPGYRVYFARHGGALVLLALGGDKSRQKIDIARAREVAAAWEPENGH
ncbi:MAG TPA: type II toxin-antitoxin system RelE/ParE family toxin [Allosphingosinicella sp.]|jgi:putative addiction module killer protein